MPKKTPKATPPATAVETKVRLDGSERIALFFALPREGEIGTMKAVRALKEMIELDEEEKKAAGFVRQGNSLTWKDEVDIDEQEYTLSPSMVSAVVDVLKKLNSDKKLPDTLVTVYEKFFPEPAAGA